MAAERKTAIVTGAASGIGRAMTLGLLGAGVDVAAVDRNDAGLAALAATVQDKPATMQALPTDLAQPEAFDSIVANVLSRFGKIDVLVNNAGIGQASIKADQRRNPIRMWEITPDQWQRFLTVNATAPILMARAVVPHMLRGGRGASSPSPPAWARWCARATCCTARARRRPRRRWRCWRRT